MEERWCSACGQKFVPRAQCPRQSYCANSACQKERKLLWQTTKRRSDSDYSANQAKANEAWTNRNPDYWKRYRAQRMSGDLSFADLGKLLADALQRHFEDASSSGHSSARSLRRKSTAILALELPVGHQSPLTLKLRIELHAHWKKSSLKVRKETTS